MFWNIDMGSVAPKAELIATGIRDAADDMQKTVDGLNWSGEGRRGAANRAERERSQMRLVADAFDDLATACRNGQDSMAPMVVTAKQTVTTLRDSGFEVDNADWSVSDPYNYQAALEAAGDNQSLIDQVNSLQSTRTTEAANQTVTLQRLAADLGWADSAAATAIRNALNSIEQLTPATSGLNPTLASQDEAALRNGTATPEQIARLQQATNLTQEQKNDLLEGKQVNLPQGQFDYLRGFMRSMDSMSVTDIDKMGAGLPADQQQQVRTSVANALQITSNPQIKTAGDPGGGIKTVEDSGGMTMLPTGVRTLLTDKAGSVLPAQRGSNKNQPVVDVPRGREFAALTNLLGTGDAGLAQGTDIDRGLLKQGAEIAALKGNTLLGGGDSTPDALADRLLTTAGGDHAAVHDLLTGQNMQATITSGTYDAGAHVAGLLDHNWTGHDAGIAKVVTTAGEFATDANPTLRAQAGQSSYVLADYVSKHSDELLHLKITGMDLFSSGTEMGVANPALTQALAYTLSPYIPDMTGVSPELLHTSGFAPINAGQPAAFTTSSQDLKNVFSVLDSNGAAAKQINTAAYSAVSELNQQFGLAEGSGHHNYTAAEWAGRIDQAARDGMQAEFSTRNLDATAQTKEQTALFDSMREGTAFVAKRMPVIGSDMLELAVKSGSPEVKMWLLGSVPDSHVTVDLTSDANPSQRYHSILAGMAQAAGPNDFRSDPDVGRYFDQTTGKLKSLEDIAGNNPQTTLTQFDSAMRNFLPNLANYDASWTIGHSPNGVPK